MTSLDSLTNFLGWCSVINLSFLCLAALGITFFRSLMVGIHGKLFKMSETELSPAYFQYLAQFKIAVLIFNVTPYIALKLIV